MPPEIEPFRESTPALAKDGPGLKRRAFTPGEALGLFLVLALATALRVWHLDRNGFGNTYYSAAVRSMLESWHNFFFVSYDPAGWVTVDKPPLALWIQAASAKAFGYSPLSLLLPQAAEGVAGVFLLYLLVRRVFGRPAALMAGLALALTPLSVAVDRYNNTDACLVFVLLAAAWAMGLAVEKGGLGRLCLALAAVGLAFNTKMMAGLIILPVFYLLYFLAAPGSWARRVRDLAVGSLVLATVSLAWVAAVDLTPADQRPFVGSTQDNSMLGLTLGWNGMQRLTGNHRRGPQGAAGGLTPSTQALPASASASASLAPGQAGSAASLGKDSLSQTAAAQAAAANGFRRRGNGRGGMGSGLPGWTRLAQPEMAGQVLWFLPLALLGLNAAWIRGRKGRPSTLPALEADQGVLRTASQKLRLALEGRPDRQALFFWGGWFAIHFLVFSFMGTLHTYYTVLLAPSMAGLTGIGLRSLWLDFKDGRRDLLPLALALTGLWQVSIVLNATDWSGAFLPLLAGGTLVSALILAFARGPKDRRLSWPRVGLATGLTALLACPAGWALTPVLSPNGGGSVQADPTLVTGLPADEAAQGRGAWRGMGGRGNSDPLKSDKRLLAYLEEHRKGAKFLVAAQNSQAVSPLIIASGEPAIALGGFMGGDPILGLEAFTRKVRSGEIRYYLAGAPGPIQERPGGVQPSPGVPGIQGAGAGPWGFGPGGGNGEAQKIDAWVRSHGLPVDPMLWRAPEAKPLYAPQNNGDASMGFRGRGGQLQLFDLSSLPVEGPKIGHVHARRWHRGRGTREG